MPNPKSRRARRAKVDLALQMEVLGEPRQDSPQLGPIAGDGKYERIEIPREMVGLQAEGTALDISENGVFVTCSLIPPLLSRVALSFSLPDYGPAVGIGLVMWRRPERVTVDGRTLEPGCGILFEAVRLKVRAAIADVVSARHKVGAGRSSTTE